MAEAEAETETTEVEVEEDRQKGYCGIIKYGKVRSITKENRSNSR